MNPDGDFEFYRFIWSGADQGWGVFSYPPEKGIKVLFNSEKPSAMEIKAIRNCWPRLASKSVSESKSIIGKSSYTFGKWRLEEAESILCEILSSGVKAEIVDVPNYSIVNMKTREAAQIRSSELYDIVTLKLIENGGEVVPHSGIYPGNGAKAVDAE